MDCQSFGGHLRVGVRTTDSDGTDDHSRRPGGSSGKEPDSNNCLARWAIDDDAGCLVHVLCVLTDGSDLMVTEPADEDAGTVEALISVAVTLVEHTADTLDESAKVMSGMDSNVDGDVFIGSVGDDDDRSGEI